MTNSEIIQLAEKIGMDELLRLANHVAAVEREACAQLVEHFDSANPTLLAEAIRARGEK